MSRVLLASSLILALIAASRLPVWAGDPVGTGLAYLSTQQQADGGFRSGFSAGSDVGTTSDVVLAIAAGGQDASTWPAGGGNSPLDYLYTQVARGAVSQPGERAKVVMALLATGQDPSAFAGHDLIAELKANHDLATGYYGGTVFDQALVMLALFDAGQWMPDRASQYLLDRQCADGAWALFGDTAAGTGDTNTTAMVVQALHATGHRDEIGGAFDYFRRVQNSDGGFPYQNPSAYGTDTDANSTALVLQALLATGAPLGEWIPGGTDPLGALVALHDSASGAFFWQAAMPYANALATAQAIPAVQGYTYTRLPRVQAANAPGPVAATAVSGGALLPPAGGAALLPVALVGLGAVALGAGRALRRKRRS